MANFYISDLHLGHSNIIHLSKRPFSNVDEMDKTIIKNWNNVITDEDDVFILGDVSYKGDNNIEDYLKQLKGKKHLIVGNHDRKIVSDRNLRKYFVEVRDMLTVQDGEDKIVLCHYPLVEWDGYFRGTLHFYGHIHNNFENDTNKYISSTKNAYNVGVDILGFVPMTKKQIIDKFN